MTQSQQTQHPTTAVTFTFHPDRMVVTDATGQILDTVTVPNPSFSDALTWLATHTPTPSPTGRPNSDGDGTRVWTQVGADFIRGTFITAYGQNAGRPYDDAQERERITAQIQQLEWQRADRFLPTLAARALQTLIEQAPIGPVTAIAVNGVLDYPEGPDTCDYPLYGIEALVARDGAAPGESLGALVRIYALYNGRTCVPVAVDEDVPEPALGTSQLVSGCTSNSAASSELRSETEQPAQG